MILKKTHIETFVMKFTGNANVVVYTSSGNYRYQKWTLQYFN